MALTQANLETALNVTFTGTPDLPTYTLNDVVYVKAEYEGSTNAGKNVFTQNPYKVKAIRLEVDGNNVDDKDGDPADGSGTASQKMWHYTVENVGTTIQSTYHQSELDNLAGIKTLVGSEVGDWTDPA